MRERAGLTQAQLAERAGLHISAVTRFEQGWREPSLATAAELAKALGVKVDEFLMPVAQSAVPRPRGRPPQAAPAVRPADGQPPIPELPARHDLPGTAPGEEAAAHKKFRGRPRKKK